MVVSVGFVLPRVFPFLLRLFFGLLLLVLVVVLLRGVLLLWFVPWLLVLRLSGFPFLRLLVLSAWFRLRFRLGAFVGLVLVLGLLSPLPLGLVFSASFGFLLGLSFRRLGALCLWVAAGGLLAVLVVLFFSNQLNSTYMSIIYLHSSLTISQFQRFKNLELFRVPHLSQTRVFHLSNAGGVLRSLDFLEKSAEMWQDHELIHATSNGISFMFFEKGDYLVKHVLWDGVVFISND